MRLTDLLDRERSFRFLIGLVLALLFLALVAIPSRTLAGFYTHLDGLSAAVERGDYEQADLELDAVNGFYERSRSFGLDWERAEPPIADYAATLLSYKQNQYEPDPRVREQVDAHWRFAVDEWNYGSPPSETP